jgi:hypothetical protein
VQKSEEYEFTPCFYKYRFQCTLVLGRASRRNRKMADTVFVFESQEIVKVDLRKDRETIQRVHMDTKMNALVSYSKHCDVQESPLRT